MLQSLFAQGENNLNVCENGPFSTLVMEKSHISCHKNLFNSALKKINSPPPFPICIFQACLLVMGESWQASWHKQVSAPSREAWDGPADVPGASRVLLPFAKTLFSLSVQGLSSSSGAMWDISIKLNSLKKTEHTPGAQGSGKRHTVFTQVLSTGPPSITVILPALASQWYLKPWHSSPLTAMYGGS